MGTVAITILAELKVLCDIIFMSCSVDSFEVSDILITRDCIYVCNGTLDGVLISSMPSKKLFQCPTMLNRVTVAIAGLASGTQIKDIICIWLIPSIFADSLMAFGWFLKKFISRITL